MSFILCRKKSFCNLKIKLLNGRNKTIKSNTPKILNIKLAFIILRVLLVFIVDIYPVIVVPMFAPNIMPSEQAKFIIFDPYICSTIEITPDDDCTIAVINVPNNVDSKIEFWVV